MSDEVLPETDNVEREDGELSDEEASEGGSPAEVAETVTERMAAGGNPSAVAPSNSSEGEIDRIVEEANRLLALQAAEGAAQPTVRNMLDTVIHGTNFDDEDSERSGGGVNLDETTLSELRAAALKSMKVPSAERREEGEVSDPSEGPTEIRKRKLSDRIQIVHSSPEFHRRRYSPLASPPRSRITSRFDTDSRKKDKRRRSRRDRSPPDTYAPAAKYTKDKDYRRSPYRKRRKSRERRPSQPDTYASAHSVVNNDSHHEPEPIRPRAERSEAERMSIVLGGPVSSSSNTLFGPLPPPPPAPILSDEAAMTTRRDNYEVVAMDVDTSSGEGSRPPTRETQPPPPPQQQQPARNRQVSEGDEAQLRNVLLLQMQKKGGGNTLMRQGREDPGNAVVTNPNAIEVERPPSIEYLQSAFPFPSGSTMVTSTPQPARMKTEFTVPGDETEYQLNKARLNSLDRLIQTRMHQMEKSSEEKEKLMRKLDEVIGQMAIYQTDYWAATEERDRLRPLVESYEVQRIRRLNDVDSLRLFTTRINQHSDNLLAIANTPLNRTINSANTSLAGDVSLPPFQEPLRQPQAAAPINIPLEHVAPLPILEVPPPVTLPRVAVVSPVAAVAPVASQWPALVPPLPVVASPSSPIAPSRVVEAAPRVAVETPPPASPSSSIRDEPMEETPVVPQEAVQEVEERVEPAREPVPEEDVSVVFSQDGEEKELRLRALLLERLEKKKAEEAQQAQSQQAPPPQPVENGQQEEEEETQMDEYLESTSEPDNDENQGERSADTARLGAINKHREHVRRVYKSHNLPLRLLPHAGVPMPNDYERQICHFELNGKCKDYTCEFVHYNDDKLSLRELMSMILFFAPELSGEAQFEEHTKQLDHVLSWQNQGEEREQFVRRVLRRLPQTRNDVDARMADVNDETGDFDAYYSSLSIVKG